MPNKPLIFSHSLYLFRTLNKIKIKAQEQTIKDLEKALQKLDIRVSIAIRD